MLKIIQKHGHIALGLLISIIFIQSLFFKFSQAPETIYIFEEKLNVWASSFGFAGLFAPGGLFAATHIGIAELIASLFILFGIVFRKKVSEGIGALIAFCIISGAIFFHLFTPLGIAVKNAAGTSDGGQLFILAVLVWISSGIIVYIRRQDLYTLIFKK